MIERLLTYLYRAYDHSSNPAVALRVRHSEGFVWAVENRRLAATTESGQVLVTLDLLTVTVKMIAESLSAAGFDVIYINPDTVDRAGQALLSGSGRESQTNGDALCVYDTLLWSFLDAYALELEAISAAIDAALTQINYATADGEFLELWGQYWGYPRLAGESDDDYRTRTLTMILQLKVNGIAMADAATRLAGVPITLYEPWRDLLILSESSLDQEIIFDGVHWSPFLFRPVLYAPDNIDWQPVIELLNRIRPTGVLQMPAEWIPSTVGINATAGHRCLLTDSTVKSAYAVYDDRFRLDYGSLDDIFTSNSLFNIYDVFGETNETGLTAHSPLDGHRSFVRAQIVLSDMDPADGFGAKRFTFAVPQQTLYYESPLLDSFALSDFIPYHETYYFEDYYDRLVQGWLSYEPSGNFYVDSHHVLWSQRLVDSPYFMVDSSLAESIVSALSFTINPIEESDTHSMSIASHLACDAVLVSDAIFVTAVYIIVSINDTWTGTWDERLWSPMQTRISTLSSAYFSQSEW